MTIREVNFLQSLHTSTKRNYLERMTADKPHCCEVAKQWGRDYWDGDRKYGYGGYKYDGRWKPVARAMLAHYGLEGGEAVLDLGCGRGFLLSDLKDEIFLQAFGVDISAYAIRERSQADYGLHLKLGHVHDLSLYIDKQFDFVYSINVFHNLGAADLKKTIQEMMRVSKPDAKRYICVESYRNEQEKFNLQCWALTCQQFHSPDDWKWLLEEYGYDGDAEFITFP